MSRETFRSVLDDRARSVFQGRIIVRPDAQKTDGKMMTRALLLSEDAEADHKPELEIFADDVTCGHGAVSGALDEDLLFYLRARGLPEAGGAGVTDPGLRRRSDRSCCRREAARGRDCCRRPLAQGARAMTMHQPIHPAVANGKLDVAKLRQDFPALAHAGLWQAAGLSRQRRLRAEAACRTRTAWTRRTEPNTPTSIAACTISPTRRPKPTRARATKAAGFINASRSEEIIFTRNATEAINLVASSFAAPMIREGDEIVLSIMEHHSNIVPWHFLRERQGAVLKWAPVGR